MKITSEIPTENAYLNKKDLKSFFILLVQFLILLGFSFYYSVEKKQGFPILLLVSFPCFILNAFLPAKWRPLVLIVAFAAVCIWSMGWVSGPFILFVSSVIFVCAELPIKLIFKLILIGGITAGMVILRTQLFFAPRAIIAVPYIASIFMFRMISYLYYKRKKFTGGTLLQRLNYFFLLPNLAFLLFPIIDYRNYIETYYSKPAIEIYRKGLYRITTGMFLLMLHRILYFYFSFPPQEVRSLGGVLAYNSISYLLIIQIVGIFQICVGWVTLFGHNLNAIFENFFFAKGFSDLWRKINHYWRDFMVKIFYFPLFFRLRKIGQYPTMVIAGLAAFFCSWMMHSQQLFWITGKFSFSANDAAYWMTMGVFITADGIYQFRNSGRTRKKISAPFAILLGGLRITGIFLFASLLWTMWNAESISSWFFIMKQARYTGLHEIILTASVILFVIILTGSYLFFFKSVSMEKREQNRLAFFPLAANSIFILLIISRFFSNYAPADSKYSIIADQIGTARVNDADREIVDLGYYDQMVESGGISSTSWQFRLTGDLNWGNASGATHRTGDILLRVFNPGANVIHHGYGVHINAMGLRDDDYSFAKSPGTIRWAFLGGSYVLGAGLEKNETFEAITEKELNDSLKKNGSGGLEILNFANGGYLLPQAVELCRTKVFNYGTDAVFYFVHPDELNYTSGALTRLIAFGIDLKGYPELQKIADEAGLKQSQSKLEMQRLLEPYREELVRWGYKSIAGECKNHNVKLFWVFLPTTTDGNTNSQFTQLSSIANEFGFTILDLTGVFAGHKASDIQISEVDNHPNAEGNILIVHKLEIEIRKKILVSSLQE